ncbi:YbaN family protein [Amylibacter sp.]|nr:YbaN family protein [Amylibacter sp.]
MRVIWLIFGYIALILAILGVILPLLPTVPFLLLAAFCFARSSEKIHKWLINHPRYGPPIYNWQNSGSINLKSKKLATICMVFALILPIYLGLNWFIIIIQIIVLSCVLIFIWTRPST